MKKETEQQRLINDVEDIKRQRRTVTKEITQMVIKAKKTPSQISYKTNLLMIKIL